MSSKVVFDDQPVLTGRGLTLRPFVAGDKARLVAAASDPAIWAGHPATDRFKPDVFGAYADMLLERGGALVVQDPATRRIIGCSRYYTAPDRPDKIAIGFTFLTTDHWGGGTNFRLKHLMLEHAFGSFDEVWFDIAPANIRSQKATEKLGAKEAYRATLDLSGAALPWVCYCLSRRAWQSHLKDRTNL
ncbi:MAG: GNAT family N-acetyltransferase [Pseudomonadota bacterium]